MTAELGLQPWGETIGELVAASREAEAAGFTSLWTTELHRSAFVHTTAVAGATTTATVGSGIALAFTRSPLTLALTALDLADVAGGRFVLGLGSGVHRLNRDWHGVDVDRPVARLRDVVAKVRALVARLPEGGPVHVDGDPPVDINGFERGFAPRRGDVPVYLAAVGPQMTRLAGEIADGWIGHQLMSSWYLRECTLPALAAGRRRSGNGPGPRTVLSVCCVPHADEREARRWAAGVVAFYGSVRTYEPFFAVHGFGAVARELQARFRAGDHAGMLDACPDEVVEAFTVAGSPDAVRRRVRELAEHVDVVKLAPPTHLVDHDVTRTVQRALLETFCHERKPS